MSELLNSGLFGVGKPKENVIKYWEASGFLYGINDETIKEKTALVLEDAANILIKVGNHNPYSGRFDTIIFPIIRRVMGSIDKGEYGYLIKDNYEEMKPGLIDLVTADFIIKKSYKLYESSLEFFGKIYNDEKVIDVEAEVAAFISETVSQMYLREFRGQNIIKGDNGYFITPKVI